VAAPDETKHFKFLGTTGTGKSTAIRELLGGALRRGDRAVIADPDGGYLARFHEPNRGDVILNPFEPRSLKWDVFAEIRNPYDFEQLARSLIPDGAGDERMWRGYGQTFLAAVMRQAHGAGVRNGAELYRLLTAAPLEELRFLLEGTAAEPFVAAGNERMFGSIRSVSTSAVSALDFVNSQQSALFSIRQWVKEGGGVLFLPYEADQIAALRSVVSTWMRIAIFETMTLGEGDAHLWFVVDERCAGSDRRIEVRTGAAAKIWGPVRVGISEHRAGDCDLWARRSRDHRGELREYADLAMFGVGGWGEGSVRSRPHW
jgi:type IV secretory pathway TraG/TraD family ATPase VirD4